MFSMLSTKCLLALFSAQLFYLSPVPLLIFGVAASHRKEAHFLTVLIRQFVHFFFLTINWVVASFVCNEDDIIDKVYHFLEFLIQRISL